jgi:ABC toxin N-terminal region/Neuraminidase-like domain
VAYLLARPDPRHPWRDVNDIYAHFLIDVEMSPCQMTSRIKQAISSVQLFVQRCLMNLEPEVLASAEVDEKWREWKWMKNYRVWEANRKVFLYPENWIEPELRDDKSPFFEALESELMQSDLTKETAEEAFHSYLEKLDQVARLEIVGIQHQVEQDLVGNKAVDILHVFGRTHGTPHVYYYRQHVDGKYWTAWERIDLDIEGDHLIPVVWNRRLYLFWPIFTEKTRPLKAKMPKEGAPFASEPKKYWEIKLAWSERKQGKWTNKKMSSTYAEINRFRISGADMSELFRRTLVTTVGNQEKVFFRWFVDDQDNLNILLLHPIALIGGRFFNFKPLAFRFDGCHTEPRIITAWKDLVDEVRETDFYRMHYKEKKGADKKLYLPAPTDTPALNKTPGTFLLLPYADGSSFTRHPFFYQDDTRAFFAIPSEILGGCPRID